MSLLDAAREQAVQKWKRAARPDVMIFGLRNIFGAQGGVESHVRHLSEHLAQRGFLVEILVRSPYGHRGAECAERIKLTEIWSPRHVAAETIVHSFLSVCYAIVRRPRLLHIQAIGPGLMTPLARLFGIKVVVTHHGKDYDREKWGPAAKALLRAGEKLAARFAHEIIAVSRPLAADLAAHYRRPFEFIPNGVTTIAPAVPQLILEKFGLHPAGYILNVGRIVPEKRQLDLIEAFRKLDPPNIKLVLVGQADHESDYSRRLAALAARDKRIVLAGFQQGGALSALFANAALFALPSSHEGLPIAVLEAMSFGLPLLISDIPANLAFDLPKTCYAAAGVVESWVEGIRRHVDQGEVETIDWSPWLTPYKWRDVSEKTAAIYERVWRQRPAMNSSE